MKRMFTTIALLAIVFFTVSIHAQTVTNVNKLQELAAEFTMQWEANAEKVRQYSALHNIPIRQELGDGRVIEMVDVKDGKPVYYETHNLGGAHTTKAAELWEGGSTGINISGEGYNKVAVWDAGAVLTSHQEFTDQGTSRVTKKDGNYPSHYHATHVGGTIAAAGISANAKGMAYGVFLDSYQWSNDNGEMATAAANGLELSNHSYGLLSGWNHNGSTWVWYGNAAIDPNEDYKFGFYGSEARAMDQIAYNAPSYLIVRSAGNDRGEGPSDPSGPENDGGADGYDCVGQEEVAKNVMTVGAVYQVPDYLEPADVRMSSFSAWGPADDGRIKPDIVAKGVDMYSCYDANNADYGLSDGTSMSAPNVTGSLVLLRQHYQNLNGGSHMRAATLKGIALHTTEEAGPDPGPDYKFGWGLMNTKRAAQLISNGQGQNSIDERILNGGDIYVREITVPEGTPELRVTISWTDPAGIPVSAQLNPRDPMLVNDIDVRVLDGASNIYYPYSLDPENPSAAATTTGKNYVDNIETVVISNPEPGTYTIQVDHDGSLNGGMQAYSLIITGIDEYTVVPECTVGMATPVDGAEDILVNEWLEWELANFASSYDIYFGTDGGGTETPTNVLNGENILTNGFSVQMQPGTTYYLQIVPRNSQGIAPECNQIYSFTTMDAVSQYPYLESFAGANPPEMVLGYQSVDFSVGLWETTDLIGHTDDASMFGHNPNGFVATQYDNWLISPPFSVEEGKEYYMSYYYKGLFPTTPESLSLYWSYSPYVADMTSLLFEDNEIYGAGWIKGSGLVVPEGADVIFFGWHLNSEAGIATLLDDVSVEDWGPVGLNPGSETDDALIYSANSMLYIQAGETWKGAGIRVTNLMGQPVYESTYHEKTTVDLRALTSGVYIVNLINNNKVITKKVIIQ